MSEHLEVQAGNAETEDDWVANFVAVLVAAREAAKLSHAQVAAELRLDVPVVRALDVGDFSALGPPVFIKGHLRGYEKLLQLSPNELVALYERIHPSAKDWRGPPSQHEQVKPANLAQWGLIGVLILAVIAVAAFLLSGSPDSAAPEESKEAPLTLLLPDAATSGEAAVEAEPVVQVTPQAGLPVAVVAQPKPVAQTAPGTTRVTLVFADDCWVEVADASGRLLVNEISAGSSREFAGVAPFSFVLGDAKAVQVSFDGVPYSVPVWSIRDNTARFKLTAADITALKDSAQ